MTEEEDVRYQEGFRQSREGTPRGEGGIFYIRGYVSGLLSIGWDKTARRGE